MTAPALAGSATAHSPVAPVGGTGAGSRTSHVGAIIQGDGTQVCVSSGSGDLEMGVVIEDTGATSGSVDIVSNTQANPTVVTTAAPHGLTSGRSTDISDNVGSDSDINGTQTVTVLSPTTFSIPVDCSVSGGTGGTCTTPNAPMTATADRVTVNAAGTYDVVLTVPIQKAGDPPTDGAAFEINLRVDTLNIQSEMTLDQVTGVGHTSRTIGWAGHLDAGDQIRAGFTNYFDVDMLVKTRVDSDEDYAGAMLSVKLRLLDAA